MVGLKQGHSEVGMFFFNPIMSNEYAPKGQNRTHERYYHEVSLQIKAAIYTSRLGMR